MVAEIKTISRINPYYWGKYFWTARRLLADNFPE